MNVAVRVREHGDEARPRPRPAPGRSVVQALGRLRLAVGARLREAPAGARCVLRAARVRRRRGRVRRPVAQRPRRHLHLRPGDRLTARRGRSFGRARIFGCPRRRRSPTTWRRPGSPIVARLEAPATADGGDTIWLDERTLLVGRGYRTNAAGVAALRAALPEVDVVEFDLPHFHGAGRGHASAVARQPGLA